MNLKENFEMANFITLLGRGIKKHGIKKIIKALKDFDLTEENINYYTIIDFVEESICMKLNVVRDELYNKKVRGDITIARKLSILLLIKHLNMSDEEIGNHYKRNRQTIYNTKKEFDALDRNNKIDANFINIYNEFDTKIQDFITEIKSKTQTQN